MPHLALLMALSSLAGRLAPGPQMTQALWTPEAFARAAPVSAFHSEVLRAALGLLGASYHYGSTPQVWGDGGAIRCPSGEHAACADCSGLVCAAYAATGVRLPHSSAALAAVGESVVAADAQPGDILAFRADGAPDGPVDHCGLYVGNGLFLHAGSRGVRLDDLEGSYWGDPRRPRLRAVRRVPPPPAAEEQQPAPR